MTDTELTVCIPTKDSSDVLDGTLTHLAVAADAAPVTINRLVIVDDESDDRTVPIAVEHADAAGWDIDAIVEPTSLPEARNRAIDEVETEWFLFLDDDVRLSETYLETLLEARAPLIGAIQGRKVSRTEAPSDWVHRRSRRGGTHATLIRRDAVGDTRIPEDLDILHDEYCRHIVERSGYLWVFNHQARFDHANQDRHPIGWREGYEGGQYGLSQFHDLALNVPFAAVTGRNPLPHAKRAAGWIAGRLGGRGDTNLDTSSSTELASSRAEA
jgi:glycosyltransferase involved in cell wall biosynthesis